MDALSQKIRNVERFNVILKTLSKYGLAEWVQQWSPEFVKQHDNVVWLKPKMNFREVIKKYGYPVVSKEQAQCIYELRTMNISPDIRTKWLTGKGNTSILP